MLPVCEPKIAIQDRACRACVGGVEPLEMKSFYSPRKGGHEMGFVYLVALCILLLAGFRVLRAGLLPELPNFSPVAAVALCGGLFLPGVLAWMLPVGILFLSDLVLAMLLGYPAFGSAQFVSWSCILAIVGIGRLLSKASFSTPRFFSALVGGGLLFYIVTNTAAWIGNPSYSSGLGGLFMSLTTGLPGYPPTWIFYRNALISDLIFGSLLLAIWAVARRVLHEKSQTVGA